MIKKKAAKPVAKKAAKSAAKKSTKPAAAHQDNSVKVAGMVDASVGKQGHA
jgi:hypothetical protein